MTKGFFISLEGIEGAGKSTAMQFLCEQLTSAQIPYLRTREPGGTPVSEAIRQVLLQHYEESIESVTELLLMFAGRAQHVSQIIKPALDEGKWVVSDRYVDASFAYQGGGRGIEEAWIKQLVGLTTQGCQADLTLILDLPVEMGLQRMRHRGANDRIEQEDVAFFQRVREVYLRIAKREPDRCRVIDASKSLVEVHQQLLAAITPLLQKVV